MIDKKIKNFIHKESIENYPNECCGFIIEDFDNNFKCIPCENIAINKQEYFSIRSTDYLNIKNKYNKIHYIYHSHTNDNFDFSEEDKRCAENLNIPIILYILKNNEIKIYEIYEIFKSYTGRFYQHGKYDCFKLIEEFYKKEKSIEFKYNKEFYNKKFEDMEIKNEFFKFYDSNNLRILDKNEQLQIHDILLIDAFGENKPKHFALYIGDDKILHQPMFGFSKIENYCNFYRRHTDSIFRLKVL